MPNCPKCHKEVSWMNLDLFGGGCSACLNIDPAAYEGLLDAPCNHCGSRDVYATAAPALAYIRTQDGNVPTKVAPGLFVLGCASCGGVVAIQRLGKESLASVRRLGRARRRRPPTIRGTGPMIAPHRASTAEKAIVRTTGKNAPLFLRKPATTPRGWSG